MRSPSHCRMGHSTSCCASKDCSFFLTVPRPYERCGRVLTDGGRVVLSVWRDLQRHPVYEVAFRSDLAAPGRGSLGRGFVFLLVECRGVECASATQGFSERK